MTTGLAAGDAKTLFARAVSDVLRAARQHCATGAAPVTARVGATEVEIAETHPVVAPFLERTLAVPTEAATGAPRFRLLCDYADPLGRHGLRAGLLAGLTRRDAERVLADLGLRGRCAFSLTAWDMIDEAAGIGIRIQASPQGHAPWEPTSPIEFFLNSIVESSGDLMLHAACVGAEGQGVLIAGDGGAGKSGTTLAAVSLGLTTVGDDYVRIARGAETVARPVFRTLKQDRAGLVRNGFGEHQNAGVTNHAGKQVISIDMLAPGALVEELRIVAIAVPRVAGGAATSFGPASKTAAFRALAPSNLARAAQGGGRMIAAISELVRDFPCFDLKLSEDPASTAHALRQIIGGAAP